ncbi:MAG: hypothetical protein RJB55_1339 [Verrucomicrobiota bacterium]|jgi:hypothetical protein
MPPPRSPRRWALLRLAAFALFTALVAALVHTAIHHGLRRVDTGGFGSANRIVQGRAPADLVITGSSRALVHYDPRVLTAATGLSALNLGRNGSHTGLQLAVLRTHLRHNPAPRLVIHNLDLHSLASPTEIHDPGQYLPYLDEPAIYAEVREVHRSAWAWRHVPLYGYAVADPRLHWLEGIVRLAGLKRPESLIAGFEPRPWSWTGEFDRFVAKASAGYQVARDDRGRDQLAALLRLCRDSGIHVILVFSPEYAAVRPLQLNRASLLAEMSALAASAHVPLWDFSDTAICSDRRLFYNSQHLNAAGAEAFSRELARRLVSSGYTAPRLTSHP